MKISWKLRDELCPRAERKPWHFRVEESFQRNPDAPVSEILRDAGLDPGFREWSAERRYAARLVFLLC